MTFKPTIWYPIAIGLTIINLVGLGFALGPGQSWHAAIHAGLAVAFGSWAQRLRQGSGRGEFQALEALEALEAEVSRLRLDVSEMQERLDFAERMLAQGSEARRVGPER